MSVVPVDREEAQAVIDRLAAEVGADLAKHPARPGGRSLGWIGRWVRRAHLVTLIDDLTRYVTGELPPEGTIADTACSNRRRIDLLPDRHGGVLERLLPRIGIRVRGCNGGDGPGRHEPVLGTTTARSTWPSSSRSRGRAVHPRGHIAGRLCCRTGGEGTPCWCSPPSGTTCPGTEPRHGHFSGSSGYREGAQPVA